jgi:hypothetical protein
MPQDEKKKPRFIPIGGSGAKAMERLLEAANLSFASPQGRPPHLSSLADYQVARLQRESLVFIRRYVHLRKVVDVDTVPLHIDVSQIGNEMFTRNPLGIEHLAEAQFIPRI